MYNPANNYRNLSGASASTKIFDQHKDMEQTPDVEGTTSSVLPSVDKFINSYRV